MPWPVVFPLGNSKLSNVPVEPQCLHAKLYGLRWNLRSQTIITLVLSSGTLKPSTSTFRSLTQLNNSAYVLAVYASMPRSPLSSQHSLPVPVSLPGGIPTHWVRNESFCYSMLPLSTSSRCASRVTKGSFPPSVPTDPDLPN